MISKNNIKKTIRKKKTKRNGGFAANIRQTFEHYQTRVTNLLLRRPHRSLRMTRVRDYKRSLELPGYWSFTNQVRRLVWSERKLFALFIIVYSTLGGVLGGLASQDTYSQLSNVLQESGGELFKGNIGQVTQAGILLVSTVTGAANTQLTETQQLLLSLLAIMGWLVIVWLLRQIVAGNKVKLRDGLYASGAPLLPTFLVSLLVVLQLLPLALAAIGFGAASSTIIPIGGAPAMLFWAAALLLGALSLYWISSTFMALIIITLPGMYPMQAIKTAGDLVVGRRIRILLRLLWGFFVALLIGALIIIPFILFDEWLKNIWPQIEWVPVIPLIVLIMGSFTIVWISTYIYLLYRKVIDDTATPA